MNILEAKNILRSAGYSLIKEGFKDYSKLIDINEIAELANSATHESLTEIVKKVAEVDPRIESIDISIINNLSNDIVAKICNIIYKNATNTSKPENNNIIEIINTLYNYI